MTRFNIGFVIFPNITRLISPVPLKCSVGVAERPDRFQRPANFRHSRTCVIAKTSGPVSSDRRLSVLPTCTFATCPPLDVICVPGGDVADALAAIETIEFIKRQSTSAKYVTSVCTGAFLLGAAGLLKGCRATTHWAYTDLLPMVGA